MAVQYLFLLVALQQVIKCNAIAPTKNRYPEGINGNRLVYNDHNNADEVAEPRRSRRSNSQSWKPRSSGAPERSSSRRGAALRLPGSSPKDVFQGDNLGNRYSLSCCYRLQNALILIGFVSRSAPADAGVAGGALFVLLFSWFLRLCALGT